MKSAAYSAVASTIGPYISFFVVSFLLDALYSDPITAPLASFTKPTYTRRHPGRSIYAHVMTMPEKCVLLRWVLGWQWSTRRVVVERYEVVGSRAWEGEEERQPVFGICIMLEEDGACMGLIRTCGDADAGRSKTSEEVWRCRRGWEGGTYQCFGVLEDCLCIFGNACCLLRLRAMSSL